jgi:hypothetical protein
MLSISGQALTKSQRRGRFRACAQLRQPRGGQQSHSWTITTALQLAPTIYRCLISDPSAPCPMHPLLSSYYSARPRAQTHPTGQANLLRPHRPSQMPQYHAPFPNVFVVILAKWRPLSDALRQIPCPVVYYCFD